MEVNVREERIEQALRPSSPPSGSARWARRRSPPGRPR